MALARAADVLLSRVLGPGIHRLESNRVVLVVGPDLVPEQPASADVDEGCVVLLARPRQAADRPGVDPKRRLRVRLAVVDVDGRRVHDHVRPVSGHRRSNVSIARNFEVSVGQADHAIVFPACKIPGDLRGEHPGASGDQQRTLAHPHAYRCTSSQSYGMLGSNGSSRFISDGSWGSVAQLAIMAGLTP